MSERDIETPKGKEDSTKAKSGDSIQKSNLRIAIVYFSILLLVFFIIPYLKGIPARRTESNIKKAASSDYFPEYIQKKDVYLETIEDEEPTQVMETSFSSLNIDLSDLSFSPVEEKAGQKEKDKCSWKGIRIRSKEDESTASYASLTIYLTPGFVQTQSYCSTEGYLISVGNYYWNYYHIPEDRWRTIFDTLNMYCKLEA